MNKIDKYLQQLNIQIDNEHKEKVREEILKFAPQEEKKILKIPIIFNISAAAAAIIIVSFISIFSYFKFIYKNSPKSNLEQTEIMDKEESKLSNKKDITKDEFNDEGYINDNLNKGKTELAEEDDIKSESEILFKEESESEKILEEEKDVLFSYNKDSDADYFYGQVEYTNELYSDYDSTILKADDRKDEKKSIDYSKNKKTMESSKEKDKEDNRGLYKRDMTDMVMETEEFDEIIKRGREEESQFVSTQEYNQLRVIPNNKDDSFKYLNQQIINKEPIDAELIKDEEIINYFNKSDDIIITNKINIEGSLDKKETYFLMVNYNPEKKIDDVEVEITFNPNVSAYYAIGYPTITNFTETDKIRSNISSNEPLIVLTKIKIENKAQELGNVRVLYKENQSKQNEISKKILYKDIKKIEDTTEIFKKSILAYMIAREAKNRDYSINDIIEFKANYIDADQKLNKSEMNDFLEFYIDNRK